MPKLSLIVAATIAAIILAPRTHGAERVEPPPSGFSR